MAKRASLDQHSPAAEGKQGQQDAWKGGKVVAGGEGVKVRQPVKGKGVLFEH